MDSVNEGLRDNGGVDTSPAIVAIAGLAAGLAPAQ